MAGAHLIIAEQNLRSNPLLTRIYSLKIVDTLLTNACSKNRGCYQWRLNEIIPYEPESKLEGQTIEQHIVTAALRANPRPKTSFPILHTLIDDER
jgi:hypothetical protein